MIIWGRFWRLETWYRGEPPFLARKMARPRIYARRLSCTHVLYKIKIYKMLHTLPQMIALHSPSHRWSEMTKWFQYRQKYIKISKSIYDEENKKYNDLNRIEPHSSLMLFFPFSNLIFSRILDTGWGPLWCWRVSYPQILVILAWLSMGKTWSDPKLTRIEWQVKTILVRRIRDNLMNHNEWRKYQEGGQKTSLPPVNTSEYEWREIILGDHRVMRRLGEEK